MDMRLSNIRSLILRGTSLFFMNITYEKILLLLHINHKELLSSWCYSIITTAAKRSSVPAAAVSTIPSQVCCSCATITPELPVS